MKKKTHEQIELEYEEMSLIIEALQKQEKKIREDRFYRREHPEAFYDVFLERYVRLLNKLSLSTKIINVPKSMQFKI